jgi:hypothetical protein
LFSSVYWCVIKSYYYGSWCSFIEMPAVP